MAIDLPRDGEDSSEPLPPAQQPVTLERLQRQLQRRLQRHLDTDGFKPALTIVGFRGSTTEVIRRDLDQPQNAVLGLVLPARYAAMGVVASSVVATPPRRNHHDAALAIGVNRRAQTVSLLATESGVIETKEPRGWLVDACLRAVGRTTPPCAIAPLAYPIALWLDRLMVALVTEQSSSPLMWSDAVDLCPVPQRWRSSDPVDLGTTLGSTTRSWKTLRRAAIEGVYSPAGVSPSLADWMDDAMFARWCMGSFPDVASLRGDVEFLAPAAVAERVEVALRAAWLVVSA